MGPDPTDSFRELRPVCIKVYKEPSTQNIKDLEAKLRVVDPLHLTQLVEYVLFPLKLALQSANATNEVQETVVGCIETLFTRVHVCQLSTFEEMFNYMCMLLSSKEGGPGQLAEIPEELKLAIVKCLSCLLQCSSLVVKGAFYSPRLLPALGHSVSILLALSEKEKARNLRVQALECLSRLACCCSGNLGWESTEVGNDPEHDEDRVALQNAIEDSVAQSFASFVPGISTTLCRIITGDTKQGHAVVTQAITLWGDILSLVMNDKHMPIKPSESKDIISQLLSLATADKSQENTELGSSNPNTERLDKLQKLRVDRTLEWFQDTGSKLKVVIGKLSVVSAHPNWKVRLSLAKFCDKLLENCKDSLQACVCTVVDLLVGLTGDDYSQVASLSKTALYKLSERLGNGPSSLNSLLEENLHLALTSLPRLMRTADDAQKIQGLNLVLGYLSLLGNRLCTLLNSSSYLKRLSLALVQVLEFDVGDVGIVEERTPSLSETAVPPSETKGENPMSYPANQFTTSKYPKYHFKHFTDDKVKVAVNQICHMLGYHGNLPLIVDHFLDLFHESKLYQKQAVYILSEIVMGSFRGVVDGETNVLNGTENPTNLVEKQSRNHQGIQTTVELLITEYISDANWNLVTSNPPVMHSRKPVSSNPQDFLTVKKETKPQKVQPFEVLNSNVQLSCLLLEAIGVFSTVTSSHFEQYLMQVLYPIMAKLGNDNAIVSRSAYETLVKICQSCGYASVDDLIARNADYLVNSISLDFKYVFMNCQAPCVLKVMIQYSNPGILSIIEDTLMDIFSVIDLYPDELMYLLMKVLNVLVLMIKKWFLAPVKKEVTETPTEENPISICQEEKQSQLDKGEETNLSTEQIRQYFLDYHKRKQQAMGYVDEAELGATEPDGSVEEEHFEPDKKPEVPRHVNYVTQVLEKCVHFLSSKSPWLRLLVLDTIDTGAQAISQSEDELLPMIHRLWPSMVKRFTDDEQVVTIKAVTVLCTMAEASGSFMQRRVIKDAIPSMTVFLEKQASVSLKAGPVYSQSQSFKQQLAVLRSLGRLCKQLEISEATLSSVVWVCAQYLSCRQPKQLQQMAVAVFRDFASVDPDLIWLSLNDLYCPGEFTSPHETFQPVRLAGVVPQSKEYAENVNILLSTI